MADIKLIALDLDGTLLTTDKKLTDRTKAVLKAARDRGIKVVLTTGVSIISGMLMPANHAATLPLSTGRSPMSLPVWPFIAKRKSCSFQRVWSIQTGSRA